MILLALETSTLMGSIALVADGKLIAENHTGIRQTYSELLLPLIDQLLRTSGISIEEIDAFAVAQGPGSFTALRIGMSVTMGLARAANKQLIPVPSLDGLAYNICCSKHLLCPLLDARRGEVYTALYDSRAGGGVQRLTPYRVIRPDKLMEDITETVVFLGDGAVLYRELLVERLQERALFAPLHLIYPRASAIAALAWQRLIGGAMAKDDAVSPLYVRTPDAEIR